MNIQAYQNYSAHASSPVSQAAYQTVAQPVSTSATPQAYQRDQFVPTGYAGPSSDSLTYGQAKNIGIRVLGRQLKLESSYIEAAFEDKTPHNPIDIEEADFNLHVKAGEFSVTDVSATLTVDEILRRQERKSGKKLPVSDLRVAFDPNNKIRVEGKFKALGFNLPFAVSGDIAVDTVGNLRYTLGEAKVAGLRVDGVMNAVGLSVDKLLKFNSPMQDGFYTEGNTMVVNLNHTLSTIDGSPGLNAHIRGVRTHLGKLELLAGETPEDAQRVIQEKNTAGLSYLKASGGHAYVDGFFVKQGAVTVYDRTPDTPLLLNRWTTDQMPEPEKRIEVHQGYLGITAPRFQELILDEVGQTDDLTEIETELRKNTARVSGKLFGSIPLSLNMTFSPTGDGRLKFTPNKAKVFGFVPVPGGLVRGQLGKVIKTGEPHGKGIAIQMGGIDLGFVSKVVHQKDYIVLVSGNPEQEYQP